MRMCICKDHTLFPSRIRIIDTRLLGTRATYSLARASGTFPPTGHRVERGERGCLASAARLDFYTTVEQPDFEGDW